MGAPCWGVVAGEGTGSAVDLQLGGKRERQRPQRNRRLSEEQRRYDAELSLYIGCTWRLDAPDEVVCGGWDDNREGGPMLTGLGRLVGGRVTAATLHEPGLDLTLAFDCDLTLRVFCDQVDEAEARDNYSLHVHEGVFVVGARSRLREEPRSD